MYGCQNNHESVGANFGITQTKATDHICLLAERHVMQYHLIHDVSGEVSVAECDDSILDQAATLVEVLA